jgi:hypothetical protein
MDNKLQRWDLDGEDEEKGGWKRNDLYAGRVLEGPGWERGRMVEALEQDSWGWEGGGRDGGARGGGRLSRWREGR